MRHDHRHEPWQFTWPEFLGTRTIYEGGRCDVLDTIRFYPGARRDAHDLFARVLGDDLGGVRAIGVLEDRDGRRVQLCVPDGEGTEIFVEMVRRPSAFAVSARMASDAPDDRSGYLAFAHPPVLVLVDMPDQTRRLSGWFCGEMLWVDASLRGLGIGRTMVMEAAERRGGRPFGDYETKFSEAGYATVRSAHREFVETALRRGDPVPAEVLVDYPDLVPRSVPSPLGW